MKTQSALFVFLFCLGLMSWNPPARAQAPGAGSPLAQQQARVNALRQEVLDLDRQIDARVEEIVQLLINTKDSTESGADVMNTKKEAVAALQKWLQTYAQERGRRLGQLQGYGSAAARADLQAEVAALDDEINTRVDQIVELAASMSTSEDLQRYDTYVADFGIAQVERADYRANQRQMSRADQTQEAVAAELEKAIAGLERDLALVPQRLPRDRQQAELDRLNQLLDARQADLRALNNASPSPEARPAGDRQADQLDRDLADARTDIRNLWTQLLAKANLLAQERQRLRQLEPRMSPPAP